MALAFVSQSAIPISSGNSNSASSTQNGNKRKKTKGVEAEARGNKLKIACIDNTVTVVSKISFECPVCFHICVPPIFQCDTGHHICEKCRNTNGGNCGSCSAPFRMTRNFFMESCYENSNFPCFFSKEGCDQVVIGKDWKKHKANCAFRPLCCPSKCNDGERGPSLFPFSKLLEHIETTKCSTAISCNDDGEFIHRFDLNADDLEKKCHMIPLQVNFDGRTFFVMNCIKKRTLNTWVTILGNEVDASEFWVQIIIKSPHTARMDANDRKFSSMSVRWKGPVVPIRSTIQSVIKEGNCLFTSVQQLKAFCNFNLDKSEKSQDTRQTKHKKLELFRVKCKLIRQ